MFESLNDQPADGLLALIKLFEKDPRPGKLDLGVGVYRDESGTTPVMRAIKAAEKELLDRQRTKSYLGPEGDTVFVDLLRPIAFGKKDHGARLVGIQTPGGSGALRLGAELIASARAGGRLWISKPTWPNHAPMLGATGLMLADYPYFDVASQALQFDQMMGTLETAQAGDVVLLHGCCHNPSGADLSELQWDAVAQLFEQRGLIPFIDLAYQGLGKNLESDAYGVRRVLGSVQEALVAFSCDKNFGLYRERTGALYGFAKSAKDAEVMAGHMAAGARVMWSMPPDHGAAAVRTILSTPTLTASWRDELASMTTRLQQVRQALAAGHSFLAPIAGQQGLFSNLAVTSQQVAALRDDHGVYMAGSGRINVAGLRVADVPVFVHALSSVGYLPAVNGKPCGRNSLLRTAMQEG